MSKPTGGVVSGGLGTKSVTGVVSAFSGGALIEASAAKSKHHVPVTSDPIIPKPARPVLHPTEQYKVRANGDYKLPGTVLKESQPIGAQKLAPAEKVKGWSNTPDGIDKPGTGARMVIKAPVNAIKSKWTVPPRPAAPPPLPLNEVLGSKMTVTLSQSDGSCDASDAATYDLVVAKFPQPKGAVKWRMELKCKGWTRAIAVMAETSTASFKIANAAEKDMQVGRALTKRGAERSITQRRVTERRLMRLMRHPHPSLPPSLRP